MPRQPRLDAPATPHHVMVRVLERRPIFWEAADRADFVAGLARCMRSLLTPLCGGPSTAGSTG